MRGSVVRVASGGGGDEPEPGPLEELTEPVGMCQGLRASGEPPAGGELVVVRQLHFEAVGAVVVEIADHPLQVLLECPQVFTRPRFRRRGLSSKDSGMMGLPFRTESQA